jgi:membrane protease YdiL (CAAX protease family)
MLVIGPYYGLAIAGGVQSLQAATTYIPSLAELVLQALVLPIFFGGLALLLHTFVCGEPLSTLQPGRSSIGLDIAHGIGVYCLLMLALLLLGMTLNAGQSEPMIPEAVRGLAEQSLADPRYMLVLFGPVFWLQAALLEEVTRAFLLLRMWRVWPAPHSRPVSVLVSAVLFGAAHIYEGWQGVAGTALIGLILGLTFLRYGRLLPLIIAHGLYNTTVLLVTLFYLQFGSSMN